MTTVNAVSSPVPSSKPVLKTIAWVGLLVGTLDICSACLQAYIAKGLMPVVILRFVASGFFGKEAFTGGPMMPVYGLLFHYFIAYSFTAFFFLIYPKVKIMSKNILATAIVYGIFMQVVTNFIIIPLSKIPKITIHLDKQLLATGILIIAIGLPLSFFAKRFYYSKRNSA
jgi:hypothetical protein